MNRRIRIALWTTAVGSVVALLVSVAWAANTVTPNMGLTIPTPNQSPGPAWANIIDNNLAIIDAHSHYGSGQGRQVPVGGVLFNSSINLVSGSTQAGATPSGSPSDLLNPRTVRFYEQTSTFTPNGSDLAALYALSNTANTTADLVFVDGAGNIIPITANGTVNAATGNITNLPTGGATYTTSSGHGTITFSTSTTTPNAIRLDSGDLTIRPTDSGTGSWKISAPTGMTSNLNMKLPTALPGSTLPITMTSGGQLATSTIGNSQIAVSAVNGTTSPTGTAGSGNISLGTVSGDAGGAGTGNIAVNTIALGNINSGTYANTSSANKLVQANAGGHIDNSFLSGITQTQMASQSVQSATTTANWSGTPQYWIDQVGMVHVTGFVTSGGGSTQATIFTLPSNMRPGSTHIYMVYNDNASQPSVGTGQPLMVQVNTNGTVQAFRTPSLDTVSGDIPAIEVNFLAGN